MQASRAQRQDDDEGDDLRFYSEEPEETNTMPQERPTNTFQPAAHEVDDGSSSDESVGPPLPSELREGRGRSVRPSGPTIPSIDDLQLRNGELGLALHLNEPIRLLTF